MGERAKRREPTDEERFQVWDDWLDGDAVGTIHRRTLDELPVSAVRQILAEEPPERIRADIRHRLDARFFWISASGLVNPTTGNEDSLIIVQSPRAYTSAIFQNAVRAIRRDMRQAGGDVDLGIIDGLEADAAVRMVNIRGSRLYRFDADGAIERVERIEVPDLDDAPGPAAP